MPRVLVIDDEPEMGRLFQRALRKQFEVVYECDATVALERLVAGERFEVIFCDLMMPRMTGIAFIGQVARLLPEELCRIVVITGGAVGDAACRFIAETTRTVLYKPFSRAEIDAVVVAILGQRCA